VESEVVSLSLPYPARGLIRSPKSSRTCSRKTSLPRKGIDTKCNTDVLLQLLPYPAGDWYLDVLSEELVLSASLPRKGIDT